MMGDFKEASGILTEEARKEWSGGGNPLSKQEISQIATRTADEVMERVREREYDSLMLNSIPYSEGSPGIVVNEAVAKASPCRCIEYRPGKKLCFSRGIIGALSDEQEGSYCPTTVLLESPDLERRMEVWMKSVETCKAEIAEIPKGERLGPWLGCMSRELTAKEIKASESGGNPSLIGPIVAATVTMQKIEEERKRKKKERGW